MVSAKLAKNGVPLYGAAVLALVLPTGWALTRYLVGTLSRDVPAAFHGVRLGMSAADVRSRFDVRGTFEARPEGPTGWALSFRANDGVAPIPEATFEFHEGLLVALRAKVRSEGLSGLSPGLTATAGTVRRIAPSDSGLFEVILLARTCPDHAAEVQRLLSGS